MRRLSLSFPLIALALSACLTAPSRAELVLLNLALGKPATASGSEVGHNPAMAVDGDTGTRWCAADEAAGYWWQVDLQKPQDLTRSRIVWETDGPRYHYKVQASSDGVQWSMLIDQTGEDASASHEHALDAKNVRFVRVTVTGLEPGHWASFREFELYGSAMVDAAQVAAGKNAALLRDVKAPAGMKVTLFAAPPDVAYPVCLAAAPTGEVFVAVDPNGSLDQKAGRGKIIQCRDTDGDGVADEFKTFAHVDSPRGMAWDASTGTMYVQHPPFVQAFHDDNADGIADRDEMLVEGIGFDLSFRGADHTTNGMRLGIDGWLYIAVGDYGFVNATGRDGKSLRLHGGGVVRVRPDGARLEIVSRGQRNIFDVAVSPTLDLFTRDNTNDGDGWDVRLSHVVPTAHFGYPSLFKHFADEIVQPLADYGGGSPTGSLYLDEPGLPDGLGLALYTCDWGTNAIYRHPLAARGATFTAEQKTFIEMSRPIDIDVDGQSRLYVASWHGGGFAYSGPDVGYIARVVNPAFAPAPQTDLASATDAALVRELACDSHTRRLAAQREILARGADRADDAALLALAETPGPLSPRVAAIFTISQLHGPDAFARLRTLMDDADVREYVIRAACDDVTHADAVPTAALVPALADPLPRVRLAAVVALGRLGKTSAVESILPLVADADPVVAHTAVNALVTLAAVEPCFKAIDESKTPLMPGVMRVLQAQHNATVVEGLIHRLDGAKDPTLRNMILKALCRLCYREAEWTGGWWSTRPDTSGPYYHAVPWEQSQTVLAALRQSLAGGDAPTRRMLLIELLRNKIDMAEATTPLIELSREDATFQATASDWVASRPGFSAALTPVLLDAARAEAQDAGVRARALAALSRSPEPTARDAAVDVIAQLKDDAPQEMKQVRSDFVRDARHAGDVSYFAKLSGDNDPARRELAMGVLLQAAASKQTPVEAHASAREAIDAAWAEPESAASLLRAIGRDKVEGYVTPVQAHLTDADPLVRDAATFAYAQIGGGAAADAGKVLISSLPYEQTLALARQEKGDAKLGAELFLRQGCVACHTVSKSEPPKGPFLGGIALRYSRPELIESILKPSEKITQGFVSHYFVTKKRERIDGFIVREAGDEVEVRTVAGLSVVLKNADVVRKGTLPTSVMPEQLVGNLSPAELASLLAYLESIKDE